MSIKLYSEQPTKRKRQRKKANVCKRLKDHLKKKTELLCVLIMGR
jgi:hypothetical protein